MRNKLKKMAFSQQIKYFYATLFLAIFILCGIIYIGTVHRIMSVSEDNTLEYGLQITENNIEAMLENINDFSKVIAFNNVTQEVLQKSAPVSYEDKMALQDEVIQMAACCEGISSIYLFDNDRNSYIAGNIYEIEAIQTYMDEISWYQTDEKDADMDSPVIFSFQPESEEKEQIISFVRIIRNLNTLDIMGSLAMNIPVSRLQETYASVIEQTGMEVMIMDQKGEVITSSYKENQWDGAEFSEEMEPGKEHYEVVYLDGRGYKIGMTEGKSGALSIVGVIPRRETMFDLGQYMMFNFLVMILGMAMCVFGASAITRRIIKPLRNMLQSMEKIKDGELKRISVIQTNREIDNLQVHYNTMLDEAEELMAQKIEEQRMRRKYELSLLQAQIKPHFLYNTFDSVCALAMMGRTKDVYTMMQALGQYYRNSLHKGQEIITVKEELNIVENYLVIQSFRYDDVFEVVYDIDESVKKYRMIKLILQPLVENAIYHGFREHELQGTITVRAKDDGDYVSLMVEDDGIGMDKEKLSSILNGSKENQGKRFGLFGTIQRIKLYYQHERKNLVNIKSELGKGTTITIWIPKEMGEEDA